MIECDWSSDGCSSDLNIAEKYRQQATAASAGFLLEALNIANRCEFGYKASGNPRLHVELTLLNLSCIGTEKKNPQTELSPAATTTPASVASTSAPIQEPAKPALPPMPKSVSLKELQKDAITEPEVKYTATNAQETAVKREFTEDELVNAWCKFAEQLPASSTRLKSHLLEHNPKLVDGTVHHTLINEIALQLMEQNRAKLSEYLNVTLQTKNIQIFWSVNDEATQPSQNEKRLYTQQDKLNYICEINPSVQDLLDKFQMDYR
jgi:DNA polymerase-3 subunit gamma/tau